MRNKITIIQSNFKVAKVFCQSNPSRIADSLFPLLLFSYPLLMQTLPKEVSIGEGFLFISESHFKINTYKKSFILK